MTLNLYNHFHNGDLFYTRILISMLSNKYNINFYHNLRPHLFYDLENVNEIIGIPLDYEINKTDYINNKINTWIGQNDMIYVGKVNAGCTFENHFYLAKEICDTLQVQIGESENYLPEINNDKIKNKVLIDFDIVDLKNKYDKLILICNGMVNSGQAFNFSFFNIIKELSERHKNVAFLITNDEIGFQSNVINISSITKTSPDLLEIGYISKNCDIIIGRASGPYCFSQNKENLLDINKTFIAISNIEQEAKFFQNMKSKFVWSNNYDILNIFNIINNEININK